MGRQGRLLRGQVKKLWCLASTDGRIALLGSCMDKTRNIYVKSEIAEIFSAHQRLLGFVDAVSLGAIDRHFDIKFENIQNTKIYGQRGDRTQDLRVYQCSKGHNPIKELTFLL